MPFYQAHALEGSSAVDLVVALYDGVIRFLHAAADAVDRRNPTARRVAVKRALDIIIHLQARLRMDIGGKPAQVLSEFYASIFAQILQASRFSSRQKFEHAIACVHSVREAWKQVAVDLNLAEQRATNPSPSGPLPFANDGQESDAANLSRWTA